MAFLYARLAGIVLVLVSVASAAGQEPRHERPSTANGGGGAEQVSDAEKILRVDTILAHDTKALKDIQQTLKRLETTYSQAEAALKRLDERLADQQKNIEKLNKAGQKPAADKLGADSQSVKARRQLASVYFDLVLKEREALQHLSNVLADKNQQTRAILKRLNTGQAPAESAEKHVPEKQTPDPSLPEEKSANEPGPLLKSPLESLLPSGSSVAGQKPAPQEPVDREINAADREVREREEAARKAEGKVKLLDKRKDYLLRIIDLEQALLKIEQRKTDNIAQQLKELGQEGLRKSNDRAAGETLKKTIAAINENRKEAKQAVQAVTERLADLQKERTRVEAGLTIAVRDAAEKKSAVETARRELASLANPYNWHNVVRWLLLHGPKILLILVAVIVLQYALRFFAKRIVKLMSRQRVRGTLQERENRAHTLVGVSRNTVSALILIGGLIMVLQEIGIPVVPLLGSAAVLGLAVAFGAQNLIKNYFYGFMVLLEDQYGVGDVVKFAGIAGQVERITLRITVLRDGEGTVHFVPHSAITTVSNMTHVWSAALFEILIDFKEDIDQVIDLIKQLGRELRQDATFGPMILADLEMAGVDRLESSGVIIQFSIKTLPLKQWDVKRELLRRIHKRFAELGIEIPYPQRSIHVDRGKPSSQEKLRNGRHEDHGAAVSHADGRGN